MPAFIVPNYLSDAIYQRLDAEIAKHPDAAKDREALLEQLLGYFNNHGVIPDFSLARKVPAPSPITQGPRP